MQATEIERSPGTPSLIVTTRRRFTPQGIVVLLLARGDAAVALDAALGVAEKLHSGHGVLLLCALRRQALATWQSVVLVSCIIVTES